METLAAEVHRAALAISQIANADRALGDDRRLLLHFRQVLRQSRLSSRSFSSSASSL